VVFPRLLLACCTRPFVSSAESLFVFEAIAGFATWSTEMFEMIDFFSVGGVFDTVFLGVVFFEATLAGLFTFAVGFAAAGVFSSGSSGDSFLRVRGFTLAGLAILLSLLVLFSVVILSSY
jgi:hypothetical protein